MRAAFYNLIMSALLISMWFVFFVFCFFKSGTNNLTLDYLILNGFIKVKVLLRESSCCTSVLFVIHQRTFQFRILLQKNLWLRQPQINWWDRAEQIILVRAIYIVDSGMNTSPTTTSVLTVLIKRCNSLNRATHYKYAC